MALIMGDFINVLSFLFHLCKCLLNICPKSAWFLVGGEKFCICCQKLKTYSRDIMIINTEHKKWRSFIPLPYIRKGWFSSWCFREASRHNFSVSADVKFRFSKGTTESTFSRPAWCCVWLAATCTTSLSSQSANLLLRTQVPTNAPERAVHDLANTWALGTLDGELDEVSGSWLRPGSDLTFVVI